MDGPTVNLSDGTRLRFARVEMRTGEKAERAARYDGTPGPGQITRAGSWLRGQNQRPPVAPIRYGTDAPPAMRCCMRENFQRG